MRRGGLGTEFFKKLLLFESMIILYPLVLSCGGISKLLRRRLGIEGVVDVMRRGRLRWFGQKEEDYWVSAGRNLEVAGSRGRGRPRMTWRARLDGDNEGYGAKAGDGNGPREVEVWHHGENS